LNCWSFRKRATESNVPSVGCRDAGAQRDAAQTVGKIPVDVTTLGADLLTAVGHKMYAPKGIAALWVRAGVHPIPLIGGGGQERGLRAGTENVAAR